MTTIVAAMIMGAGITLLALIGALVEIVIQAIKGE